MRPPPSPIINSLRALREITAIEAAEAIEQPFLDYLAAEFAIDDKVALSEAILTMAYCYEGAERFNTELKLQHGAKRVAQKACGAARRASRRLRKQVVSSGPPSST